MDTSHRLNEQIRITPVRVVHHDGEILGIIPTSQALQIASESGMDLVEVAPTEKPPVCRIMDYGKFKYEQKKKQQSKTSKQHQTQIKEIRLRPKIGEHDIAFKVKQAREFLENKDKVKVNVQFKGRENAHHELGRGVLEQVQKMLEDIAKVEKSAGMESGRSMSMILAPK
ncbi:MAG: translation initiation factor IF-3 [Planctomycetota bacterium]|nr:translation initiation factor IF-3 [Planctomycetota bacterium]MDA1212811.1 translation initiation factor IF-3 [Planctomycetota bacterium]